MANERSKVSARRRRQALVLPIALVLAAAVVSAAVAGQPPADAGLGRYIVTLRDSVDHPGTVASAQTRRLGGRVGFVYRYAPIGYSAILPDAAVNALREDPLVTSVVRDRHNADALGQAPSTGIKRVYTFGNKALQIDEKNNFTVNADVAVLDGGFSPETSDLNVTKQVYCNGNAEAATCKEGEGDDDPDGHGTRVASVVGAVDNGEGVVGVAPAVRLWSVKVFDPGVFESEIVAGINYVIEHAAEIEVLNMSIYCLELPCERNAAVAAIKKAVEAGVVVVVIAGNNGEDAKGSAYASHSDVIAVSGIADYDGKPEAEAPTAWVPSCSTTKQEKDTGQVGNDDDLYSKSNYGTVIDVAAPGVCILTLMPCGATVYSTGTSFAGPHVSGAAAILAAQSNPNSKEAVEKSAKRSKTPATSAGTTPRETA